MEPYTASLTTTEWPRHHKNAGGAALRGYLEFLCATWGLVLGAFLLCPVGVDGDDSIIINTQPISMNDPRVWRQTKCCGPNSLFMLLRLLDYDVTYEAVSAECGHERVASSFLELKTAASHFGMDPRLFRITPDELQGEMLPGIALVRANRSGVGHFVVIQSRDGNRLTVLDGTTGVIKVRSMSEFSRDWDGYLLTNDSAHASLLRLLRWGIASLGGIAVVIFICAVTTRVKRQIGSGKIKD